MASKKFFGVLVAVLVGMAVMGCGSTEPAAQSSVPIDPRLVGTWIVVYADGTTDVLTFQSDNTASLRGQTLWVRDGGTTLIVAANDKRLTGKIENGQFILDQKFTFYKAAGSVEVANTTWSVTASVETATGPADVGIVYRFDDDGTFKVEYAEGTVLDSLVGIGQLFAEQGGYEFGTGTYSVSGYKVILKPNGGSYFSVNSDHEFVSDAAAETYTFYAANDLLFLHGIPYTRQ
jgi:hypothetical protein